MEGELTYNGKNQKPEFTVIVNGKQLEENVDFKVMVEVQSEPGEYIAVVYGIGDYCGYVVTGFTLTGEAEAVE